MDIELAGMAGDGPWLPDGIGLPEDARGLVGDAPVHLRLSLPGRHPRAGCNGGLGEWWSGLVAEVTCPDCLTVVHA